MSTHGFNVSAAVIRQLGEELITDEVTAIMELVKNSYDADATWVKIDINTKDSFHTLNSQAYYKNTRGYIIVEDDGHGMDDDDIVKKWLMISISEKRNIKLKGESSPGGRTPLGDKGVGRLSTQKLASKVEMFTSKENLSDLIHLSFNWDDFNDYTPITEVKTEFELLNKDQKPKGTLLALSDVINSEVWDGESWSRFRGQLSKLISPFEQKKGFKVYLKKDGIDYDLEELNKEIRKQAVANYGFDLQDNCLTIEGKLKFQKLAGGTSPADKSFFEEFILKDKGVDFFNFLKDSKKNKQFFIEHVKYLNNEQDFISFSMPININDLQLIRRANNESEDNPQIMHPGNFHGEIDDYYFSSSDELSSAFDNLATFKNLVKNQAGVRIYRDGFGIKPYGFDGNDWLGLSKGTTSGASFYGLRPSNTVGFISISAKDNSQLKEKTDREGFVDTSYAKNFFKVVNKVIDQINDLLTSIRRGFNTYKKQKNEELGRFDSVDDAFTKVNEMKSSIDSLMLKSDEVKAQLYKFSNYLALEEQIIPKDNSQANDLLKSAKDILSLAQHLLSNTDQIIQSAKKVENFANYIKPELENLEGQIIYISELAGMGLTAESLSHELSNIVDRINEELQRFAKAVSTNKLTPVIINIFTTQIKDSLSSFRKQLSYIQPALKYVREKKETFLVSEIIDQTIDHYNSRLARSKIGIKKIIKGENYSIKFSKGKLIQVLDNLILNSEYWLKDYIKANPKHNGIVYIEIANPYILVYDNGLGVNPSLENRIFQPFVSGKPKNEGRGLGLFIIQQLLETEGCSLSLLNEKNTFDRRYKFQVNLTTAIVK